MHARELPGHDIIFDDQKAPKISYIPSKIDYFRQCCCGTLGNFWHQSRRDEEARQSRRDEQDDGDGDSILRES
jgi:hypothetical protein